MTPKEFLSKADPAHKEIMSSIHQIILDTSKRVKPEVAGMMGKEMIQYKIGEAFMYALSSGKANISLHILPIYGSAELNAKYKKLLSKAKVQKGCINFTKAEQMPLDIVKALIKECAAAEDSIIAKYSKKK